MLLPQTILWNLRWFWKCPMRTVKYYIWSIGWKPGKIISKMLTWLHSPFTFLSTLSILHSISKSIENISNNRELFDKIVLILQTHSISLEVLYHTYTIFRDFERSGIQGRIENIPDLNTILNAVVKNPVSLNPNREDCSIKLQELWDQIVSLAKQHRY